jgi:hypothetical protein
MAVIGLKYFSWRSAFFFNYRQLVVGTFEMVKNSQI